MLPGKWQLLCRINPVRAAGEVGGVMPKNYQEACADTVDFS